MQNHNTTQLPAGQPYMYFATTSKVKFDQYGTIFADLGVELRRGTAITSVLIEPQVDHAIEGATLAVVSHPLRQAARFVTRMGQVPYMIEDTMLFVHALSKDMDKGIGLPGADTKNWWANMGAEGLIRFLHNVEDRQALFMSQIGVYMGEGEYVFSKAELSGSIASESRTAEVASREYPRSNPFYFHQIFTPAGSHQTLAEMNGAEFSAVDYRRRCASRLLVQLLQEKKVIPVDHQLKLRLEAGT